MLYIMTQEHYKMSDNTNNKRMFTLWHIAAVAIAVVSMLIEVLTSTAFIGLMLVFIGIYWATKRNTEIPADEMHIKINEKAGTNAFWTVMGLMGILGYVTHYSPGLLEIHDVIELAIIIGMFIFVASRFY